MVCGLSSRVVCHQEWSVIKSGLSSRVVCHQEWSVTKSGLSSRVVCHQEWSVIKSGLSPRVVCHQEWSVTKSGLSSRVVCHQEWSVIFSSYPTHPAHNPRRGIHTFSQHFLRHQKRTSMDMRQFRVFLFCFLFSFFVYKFTRHSTWSQGEINIFIFKKGVGVGVVVVRGAGKKLRSLADSLRSQMILHRAFVNIHRSGVLAVLAWLVPHETAAVSARSVYPIQLCTMTLHAKPHRSYPLTPTPNLNALPG